MRYPSPLVEAVFDRRVNRYRAVCYVDGRPAEVHVPNSGRMGELLVRGAKALLNPGTNPDRKTAYDLCMVRHARRWVGVDSRLPPKLLAEGVREGTLPEWTSAEVLRMEPRFGAGRLDLALRHEDALWLVETKSVNLVVDRTAYFPDAPTVRGARHLTEMAQAARRGEGRFALWFVVQRADAGTVSPSRERDPAFAQALWDAQAAGVRIGACRCEVTRRGLRIVDAIPVRLGR